MIDVARIDFWAASGSGVLHRASAISKVLFVLLVVAAAVTAESPYPLACAYVLMFVAATAAGLPVLRMAALSLYAIVFVFLYGLSLQGGPWVYALLFFKATTPAFAVLTLIVSTPYPRLFAVLSAALPEIIAAGLLMTYRTFFILFDMMGNFISAIGLRGGFSPGSLVKNSANISKGIGMLFVRAAEQSTRIYAVMAVRGYSGRMASTDVEKMRKDDWLPLGMGLVILLIAIVWK